MASGGFRLLQLCPHDSPPFGELCRSFAAAARREGGTVRTVYLGEPAGQALPEADYLRVRRLSDNRSLGSALRESLAAEAPYDLVLAHRYRAYRAALAAGLPAARLVVLAHEYGMLNDVSRRLHRRLFGRGATFAGVSLPVARELAGVTGRECVLPNVLAGDAEPLARDAARAALTLPAQAPLIGVVGRLHYKKRPLLACAVHALVRQSRPDVGRVFLGAGPDEAEIRRAGGDNVYLPGVVADARRYMGAFDVLLHTGDHEAFGMVLLEAMAAGVPPVVGPLAVAAGPLWVLDGHGYAAAEDSAAAYADALLEALGEPPGQAAARRAHVTQHFSPAALQQRLAALVSEVGRQA